MTYCDCAPLRADSPAGNLPGGIPRTLHRNLIALGQSCRIDLYRFVVSVRRGVVLHNLHAAAMAMHVAKAADVHQDVEAELLSGAEGARDFIVTPAMTQAHLDDLAALRLRQRANDVRICRYG